MGNQTIQPLVTLNRPAPVLASPMAKTQALQGGLFLEPMPSPYHDD
jgi:hypothetical protein